MLKGKAPVLCTHFATANTQTRAQQTFEQTSQTGVSEEDGDKDKTTMCTPWEKAYVSVKMSDVYRGISYRPAHLMSRSKTTPIKRERTDL